MDKFNAWLSHSKASTQQLGRQGEDLALAHLKNQQLTLLARNWHCRGGELDLVMLDGDTVVFVEVRYRKYEQFGGAIESIDQRKRSHLALAAQRYLLEHPRWQSQPCRFDVVILKPSHPTPCVEWLKNAFDT